MLRLKNRKFLTGFTLIELLVVIAIIGLLVAIVLVAVNSARIKARDVRRKADLAQFYTALMLYYDDHGYLPSPDSYGENGVGAWDYSTQDPNNNGKYFLEFLEPQYIAKVGLDPINNGVGDVFFGGTGYAYAYYCYTAAWAHPDTFLLGAKLENGNVWWYGGNYIPVKCK